MGMEINGSIIILGMTDVKVFKKWKYMEVYGSIKKLGMIVMEVFVIMDDRNGSI